MTREQMIDTAVRKAFAAIYRDPRCERDQMVRTLQWMSLSGAHAPGEGSAIDREITAVRRWFAELRLGLVVR